MGADIGTGFKVVLFFMLKMKVLQTSNTYRPYLLVELYTVYRLLYTATTEMKLKSDRIVTESNREGLNVECPI